MITKIFSSSFLITFLTLIFFLSIDCNQNKIIDEEKFVKIYADIIIANDTISGASHSADTVLQRVLLKHNVTLEQYEATVQYYNQDSERWEKFFSKAIAYLEQKKKNAAK